MDSVFLSCAWCKKRFVREGDDESLFCSNEHRRLADDLRRRVVDLEEPGNPPQHLKDPLNQDFLKTSRMDRCV